MSIVIKNILNLSRYNHNNISLYKYTPLLLKTIVNQKSSTYCSQASVGNVATSSATKGGFFAKMLRKAGIPIDLKHSRMKLKISALRIYLCSVELVDYNEFVKEFNLPDTFNTWFRLTELHIWLVMVRFVKEGDTGLYMRNKMLESMWIDVDKRSRKLGTDKVSLSNRSEGIGEIAGHFKAALFAYDEGLLSNDMVLAGAVWRNFFEMECEDPEHIELMVAYIRKQLQFMDTQSCKELISIGTVRFLPLRGDIENIKRNRDILEQIHRRLS